MCLYLGVGLDIPNAAKQNKDTQNILQNTMPHLIWSSMSQTTCLLRARERERGREREGERCIEQPRTRQQTHAPLCAQVYSPRAASQRSSASCSAGSTSTPSSPRHHRSPWTSCGARRGARPEFARGVDSRRGRARPRQHARVCCRFTNP